MKVEYYDDKKIAIFNGRSFVKDEKTNYYLSSRPFENGKRKRLHVYVWEYYNGVIPKGYHVHHIDHDKGNNEISNLQIMTTSEHMKHHQATLSDELVEKRRRNLIEKAVPASKAWHASKEGKKWHSENAKKMMQNRQLQSYSCTYCGKEFQTKHRYPKNKNRFCSNNCKSAYRRKMGFDNVAFTCSVCGKTFTANKYSKRSRCGECANIRVK